MPNQMTHLLWKKGVTIWLHHALRLIYQKILYIMAAIRNSYLNAIKYIQINSMWRIITAHNWEVSVRNRDIHNFPRHKPIRALALHCRCPSDHFHRLFPPKTFAWPAPPQPGGPHPLSHWQLVPASRPCRGLPAVGTCRHQPNQSICCAIHNNKKRCLRWLKFNTCLSSFVDPKQNCNKIEAQAIY